MFKPDFDKHELIPAIVQNATTGRVLMLAYMNQEAFEKTVATGLCHFWSRSRNEIWLKGSTSGNRLLVGAMELDCDSDSILVLAQPEGPSCHTGSESCFDSSHEIVGERATDD
jgi:phosphoribosyl-ATP pyrophosphohydrolase/phosphoribosyl-AMP cyclohydrolase